MVTALNFTGGATVCNSTNRSCTFAQLDCGESYLLSVVGFNGNCTSEPSESFNLNTGETNLHTGEGYFSLRLIELVKTDTDIADCYINTAVLRIVLQTNVIK